MPARASRHERGDTVMTDKALEAAARVWTKWSDRRPPNAPGEYRYRCSCDVLGMVLTPEWTEKMSLCGMGYGDAEWWPLSPCYWDGYNRYITHEGLEWSEPDPADPEGVVWGGLELLPCPFTGNTAQVKAHGRYIGAPIWHTEAISVGSPAVPFRRFTDTKKMVEFWNRRAPVSSLPGEAEVVAWVDAGTIDLPWEKKIVATNPEYVKRNEGLGQFHPLVTLASLQAIQARAEKAERERDEAEQAENEAKDCFWAIYPKYLEMGGEPVSTEIARTELAKHAEAAEARVKEMLTDAADAHQALLARAGAAVEALRVIADGEGHADEIARQTLEFIAASGLQETVI